MCVRPVAGNWKVVRRQSAASSKGTRGGWGAREKGYAPFRYWVGPGVGAPPRPSRKKYLWTPVCAFLMHFRAFGARLLVVLS